MYAKLIDNKIEFAPQNKGAIINYNTNIELMKADGYKFFVEVPKPITNRMYHIEYMTTVDEIKEIIVYDETQQEADAREATEEKERIGNLQCTKRVFVLMLEQLGFDYYGQILPLIQANRQAQLEWDLCVELQRKNPLLDVMGAQLGVTSVQIDNLFKYANNEISKEDFLNDKI